MTTITRLTAGEVRTRKGPLSRHSRIGSVEPSTLVTSVARDYRLLGGIVRYISTDPEHWEHEPTCAARLLALLTDSKAVLPGRGILWRAEPLLGTKAYQPDYPQRGFRSWTMSKRIAMTIGATLAGGRWRLISIESPVRALPVGQLLEEARRGGLSAAIRDPFQEWLVLDEDVRDADVLTGPALEALCRDPNAGSKKSDEIMGHTRSRRCA